MGADAKPRTWAIVLAVLVLNGVLLVSALLAFCGLINYTDTYRPERLWGGVAMAVGAVLGLSSLVSILSLIVRKRPVWIVAVGLMAFSVVAVVGLIVVSVNMTNSHSGYSHTGRGADMLVFGILCPGLVGLLTFMRRHGRNRTPSPPSAHPNNIRMLDGGTCRNPQPS